jgi:pSer/pThr/pTyr-binding forkhead associated (FHA) protein
MTAPPESKVSVTVSVHRRDRLLKTITLSDPIIRIGTDPRSQLCLQDATATRTHAIIEMKEEEGPTLIDLGSTAGTWVNGARVNRCRLRQGDQVRIGTTLIQIEAVTG